MLSVARSRSSRPQVHAQPTARPKVTSVPRVVPNGFRVRDTPVEFETGPWRAKTQRFENRLSYRARRRAQAQRARPVVLERRDAGNRSQIHPSPKSITGRRVLGALPPTRIGGRRCWIGLGHDQIASKSTCRPWNARISHRSRWCRTAPSLGNYRCSTSQRGR